MNAVPAAWTAVAATFGVAAAVFLAIDMDGDGAAGAVEAFTLTQPWISDSDGDGLADGWERNAGLDARSGDSDGDALGDADELSRGMDPTARDSDGDGQADAADGVADCDQDGFVSASDTDDDADGYPDGLELAYHCQADRDGDGVLDGSEGNRLCQNKPDCDEDGLRDGEEQAPYDPLNADSFGGGLPDGVTHAFELAGQEPSADADQDGIPDKWESGSGLVAWGALQPQAGRRDFLVEFLRVQGPDSGRYASLDFAPAYEAVAQTLLDEASLTMDWVETVVTLSAEQVAPAGVDGDDAYYSQVLPLGQFSSNPFVATLVLSPQHDQSATIHAGIGQLRGMLAAVDYGMHVNARFTYQNGDDALSLLVGFESLAIDGRQDLIDEVPGIRTATVNGAGQVVITTDQGNSYTWTPRWFHTAPVYRSGSFSETLEPNGAVVLADDLAQTILHEMGHTMGLCHPHEAECLASYPAFSAFDTAHQADSTMSYDAADGTLHFLPSEWAIVSTYLACPPVGPITLVAQGATAAAIRTEKYGDTSAATTIDSRVCGVFTKLPHDVTPVAGSTYVVPEGRRDPSRGDGDPLASFVFLGVALVATAAAGAVTFVVRRRAG